MALNSKKADFSSKAPVIEDPKIQSRTWFSSCYVRFSKRTANGAAHALAQEGAQYVVNTTKIWDYEVPERARVAVMGDSTQTVS